MVVRQDTSTLIEGEIGLHIRDVLQRRVCDKASRTVDIITGCLVMSNEKKFVEDSLRSHLRWVDKLIVYDGSDDGTRELVEPYADLVIKQRGDDVDFSRFKNECLEAVTTPWTLFFHADEILVGLAWCDKNKLKSFLTKSSEGSYYIPRFWAPYGLGFPDVQTNLVRRGKGHYTKKLHEEWIPPPNQIMWQLLIFHRQRTAEEVKERNARFEAIDPVIDAECEEHWGRMQRSWVDSLKRYRKTT
jgi:hypothetical protein